MSAYVYGDPIYVTVTPKATGKAPVKKVRALNTPQAGQMAIYEEDRQLTEAKDVTSGSELTFTIDTAKANLGKGRHTLTAKFDRIAKYGSAGRNGASIYSAGRDCKSGGCGSGRIVYLYRLSVIPCCKRNIKKWNTAHEGSRLYAWPIRITPMRAQQP